MGFSISCWYMIAGWTVLGFVFYAFASPMRKEVSEKEQRWLVLNEQ